ncbi:MAG: hypothetical protein MJY61_03830 [Bacteroidales bacterium]|nr:hypothetical protein [Bacteroidales bacterium]
MIVTLTGFMGCGKSNVGKSLAGKLGWDFLDLDTYIITRAARTMEDLFSEGQQDFRALEASCLKSIFDSVTENTVLALGGGSTLNEDSAKLVLERSLCIYLQTSAEQIRSRLSRDPGVRPLYDKGNAEELLLGRLPVYERAHYSVNTDALTVEEVSDILSDYILSLL